MALGAEVWPAAGERPTAGEMPAAGGRPAAVLWGRPLCTAKGLSTTLRAGLRRVAPPTAKVLEVLVEREHLLFPISCDASLLVVADALFEEVGFALERNHVHPREGVLRAVDLVAAE